MSSAAYSCARPRCRDVSGTCILSKEHSGRVWLWRWPELLWWKGVHGASVRPHDIAWLGVYGSTANGCPGDIWGLDRNGDLLVIELKVWPGRDDPFSRFVPIAQDRRQFAADILANDWRRRLHDELEYEKTARRLLRRRADRAPAVARGLLPYYSRREALHAWPDLYESLLDRVSSADYRALVESRLDLRRRADDSPPHFIGFAMMHRDEQPTLSGSWGQGYTDLCEAAGPKRVHYRAAIAKLSSGRDAVVTPVDWQR